MHADPADAAPRALFQLVGHPLRWRLLGHLAHSDRTVRELTAAMGAAQNLISYHLGRLRVAGLVRSRRSAADGRDAYYRVDLARLGALLSASGAALHPGLRLVPAPVAPSPSTGRTPWVLFVCTGNSGRSQMAEALLRNRSRGLVEVRSAGTRPKPLHPEAVRALRDHHAIDIAHQRPKHVDEVAEEPFDRVVTLCDRAREVCPELPGHPEASHWSMADPAAAAVGEADPDATRFAFEQTAADLVERIDLLLPTLVLTAVRS